MNFFHTTFLMPFPVIHNLARSNCEVENELRVSHILYSVEERLAATVVFLSKVYCHLYFDEILGEFSTLEFRTILC